MGVHRLPGLETLRFELAPTGSGDVHLRVAVGGADDDAPSPSAPPTPRCRALRTSSTSRTRSTRSAPSPRAREPSGARGRRLRGGRGRLAAHRRGPRRHEGLRPFDRRRSPGPSKTVVVPTLPPFDPSLVDDPFWAFEPRGGAGEDSAEGEEPGEDFDLAAEDDDPNKPSALRRRRGVGGGGRRGGRPRRRRRPKPPRRWRPERRGVFFRPRVARAEPFTPGGAGGRRRRRRRRRRAPSPPSSVGVVALGVRVRAAAGAPDGFPRSPWATSEDEAHASPRVRCWRISPRWTRRGGPA